jgi:hypothetical protein
MHKLASLDLRKLLLPLLLIACTEKPAPLVPDYLDGKDDSAQKPASIVDLKDSATASFTAKSQYRAFRFNGEKGQKVSIYLDGLKGLDTVVYLYRANDNPTGRALKWNDDTHDGSWTKNPLSSSIVDYTLPETRSYAIVATTYDGWTGKASVSLKTASSGCSANSDCASDQYCAVASCGGTGTSTTRPHVCIEIFKPVCGCDGKTWSNDCVANSNGTSVASDGPCALSSDDVDDAARAHVFGSAAGQTIYSSESAAETADQAHPIDGYWLARDGASNKFVSGIHDLWAERFTVDTASGEVTTTGEH